MIVTISHIEGSTIMSAKELDTVVNRSAIHSSRWPERNNKVVHCRRIFETEENDHG